MRLVDGFKIRPECIVTDKIVLYSGAMAYLRWSSLWIVIVFSVVRTAPASPCVYEGRTYQAGQSWYAHDGCNICTCDLFNGLYCQTDSTDSNCMPGHTAGDPVCTYYFHTHNVGDVFMAADGCNKCLCTERGMQCTGKACNASGFAKPKFQDLPLDCRYRETDGWYSLGAQWQAVDGCNTCVCLRPGNFQGYYTCTTSSCCGAGTNLKDIITAKPKFQELPGECHYRGNDGWYVLGAQWQAVDGCNTCVCLMPGNYQGYYACTTSSCCGGGTAIKDIITDLMSKCSGPPWAQYSEEKHFPGYHFCCPGTGLDVRLDNQDELIPGEYPDIEEVKQQLVNLLMK